MTDRSPLLPPEFLQAGMSLGRLGIPEPSVILLILGDNLEELVLASSVIEPLHDRWPRTRLWLLTGQDGVDLFGEAPGVAGVLTFRRDVPDQAWALTPALFRRLREEISPDWAVTVPFSRDLLLDAFALATGAGIRIAHLGDRRREPEDELEQTATFHTHLLVAGPEAGSELDRHQALLEALGVAGPQPRPKVWLRKGDRENGHRILVRHGLGEKPFLAVVPGATDPQRIYPYWGEVLREVASGQPDLRMVLLGGDRDADLIARIAESLPKAPVDLCGKLNLGEMAGVLAQARLVLAPESGLAQLACVLGTPLVAVQGGGCFGRFLPYAAGTTCAVNPLACFACDWSCSEERTHCVLDLRPSTVAQAVRKALAADSPGTVPELVVQAGPRPEGGPAPLDLAPHLALDQVAFEQVQAGPPDPEVDFSLVVTSMGRPDLLEAMLRTVPSALAGATWELIGIHPAQDAETGQVFERHGAACILHDEDHRGPDGGFSWSILMNAGFQRAHGRWIMYGSDDLLFEPESIARAMAYGDLSGPRTGGVALLEHNPSRRDCPEWFIPMGYDRRPMINFGVVRRDTFLRVGGFHDGFHFYCADFDLCSRIIAAGWEILPLWDARVRHHQVLADHSHTAHESRHDADRALMFARAHLHPSSLWPDGRKEYSDLAGEQARIFAFHILETQVRTGLLRNPDAFGRRMAAWARRLPFFGALKAAEAMACHLRGEAEEAARRFEEAARCGWTGPWQEGPAGIPAGKPRPVRARTTVICAVWHRDPHRFELLKGHQACLDAQIVPVERIYVFDGGDAPPDWLRGRHITSPEPLAIYEAWARALEVVETPYVANLNLDDRFNPDAVAIYERVLDEGADLVGGDWQICFSQVETDAVTRSREAMVLPFAPAWPPEPGTVVRLGSGTGDRGTLGPACAWRMDLHRQVRPFPSRFGDGSPVRVIGDALWWRLLVDAGRNVRRIPVVVGRYHSHPGEQAEFRNPAEAEETTYRAKGLA